MATALPVLAPVTERPRLGPLALWAMLGFCAGPPFFMFSTVLALRLAEHGVGLVVPTLFVVQLAFWTTTLEVAADGWRCEFAPTPEARVPIVAANLWGYRPAMVAANGMACAVFVIYLSMLVNPRWPGAQYALLSGFAFCSRACSPARRGRCRRGSAMMASS